MGVGVANEMVGVAVGVGLGSAVAVGTGVCVGVAVGNGMKVGVKVGMSVGRGVSVGAVPPPQAASTSREKKSPTNTDAVTLPLLENQRQLSVYVRRAARLALDQFQICNSIYLPSLGKNLPLTNLQSMQA